MEKYSFKMGVRGLSTYVSENSNRYLKPYELCNTYLVIDGNNVASNLYTRVSERHSAFGGDYDEYYKTVADFFSLLNKCVVTPIVLFDGGFEKKKLKTIMSRKVDMVYSLKNFSKGFNPSKFFPLFMKQTFFDVMADMNIFCIQCDFEADIEIAATARALNCPVLSYDSDFFIFDVLYIPFTTVEIKSIQYPYSNKYYMRCSIFHVNNILNEFPGLDKFHFPILATLVGNDYIESSLFQKFFNHVTMPKSKKLTLSQRKIDGVLHWLQKENVESATNLILSHVGKKNTTKVLQAIKSSTIDYTSNFVSGPILDKLTSLLKNTKLKKKCFDLNMPNEIMKLYYQCKIHKVIIDILSYGIYFTALQVEDVNCQSSHMPALPLIESLYMLLIPYMGKPHPLKLYMLKKYDILKESEQERLKWLCRIVGIDDEDLNIVSTNYWSIFLMSFIYWVKKLNDSISSTHIEALVLMVIANEVVQKSVGYFKSCSRFMKSKSAEINKLKSTELKVGSSTTFNEMLKSVTLYEKLHIYSSLFLYKNTTEKGSGKAYDISIIHLFGSFQSCLFYVMQLNALLNYPLPHLKISDFYSGTLLFNFYLAIKEKPNFGHNFFKNMPNLDKIYTYLYESFCKFCANNVAPKVRKSRKKKNKNKKNPEKSNNNLETNTEIIFHENDEDSDYVDENNPYAILKNGSM